jgi:hypothetical protein
MSPARLGHGSNVLSSDLRSCWDGLAGDAAAAPRATRRRATAKYVLFPLAEVVVPRRLFARILGRIARLSPACASG